jgi:hypothetical protein
LAVVPSQSAPEQAVAASPVDCESNSAAPMIDTILAVGFAAATFAAVTAEEEEADGETWSAVSTLGVGTATTAAFVASAVHGHNSIQSCLAQVKVRSGGAPSETKVARVSAGRGVIAAGAKYGPSVAAR